MSDVFGRMVQIFRLDLMLQIGLATLLGGAIGLEREMGGKPAGLRTNILICVGSVLYTHLSIAMLSAGGGAIPPGTDTTRVAAQIVTGVGFIGAGTILHARGAVVGLTSAATIWVVAAIGIALGSGYYLEGVGTTLAVVVVLAGLGRVEKVLQSHSMRSTITVPPIRKVNCTPTRCSPGCWASTTWTTRPHVAKSFSVWSIRGLRRDTCRQDKSVWLVR
jgi:putative Mg2+ transporter-C (MgtC) family protein